MITYYFFGQSYELSTNSVRITQCTRMIHSKRRMHISTENTLTAILAMEHNVYINFCATLYTKK